MKHPYHRGYWKFQKDGAYKSILFIIFGICIFDIFPLWINCELPREWDEVLGVIHSTEISGNFGTQCNWKTFRKNGSPFRWTTFPSRTSLKFVKWITPIETAIYFAVARVGEFVRDNASLGEIRKFEHNLKRRVRAS